ncbi:hypothetical protein FB45DRAFT_997895 [Roridomyces roridus]|uniref:F-box domain-containing protein n=1 Tax=Roridomyces roridus TaxID=1738132 RepID=A0AAD7CKV2_9AGAR|nr:hypothetical protein FB45DRAFT_997895 [Roridomyces roridus]
MPSAGFAVTRHRQPRLFHCYLFLETGVYWRRADFAPMRDFPEELLDRICFFMGRQELCIVMHVSCSLRRVASPHLLARLGISQSDVQAGTVKLALSDSLHLILFVAHICPIQRLECFENSKNMQLSEFQRLAAILGVTTRIPDLVIHDKLDERQRRDIDSLPLYLLPHLPQTATDTLLIVLSAWNSSLSRYSTSIHLSRPREGPPPTGPLPVYIYPESTPPGMLMEMFSIILILVLEMYNLYTVMRRLFRRVFGRGWSVEGRISKDVYPEHLQLSGGIHVQSLPNKYTLVTQLESVPGQRIFIKPLRDVPESVYLAFLTSLDLQFEEATVTTGSNLTLADLATFVAGQNNLHVLNCYSIRYSSLTPESSSQYHVASKIVHLTAKASYIPHLLPLAPDVQYLYLSFPSVSNRLIGPWVFNFFPYCTALEAIARLPGSHPLAISLTFNLAAAHLPWQIQVGSDDPQPETQLHRVEHIQLRHTWAKRYCHYLFTPCTIRALVPWLARFPSLRQLSFDKTSVAAMGQDERLELATVIASACPAMSGAGDVIF